ncbi:hypothetical protein LTR16_002663 [Cryomyces antarcticus]|uniref:Uncharacterized protein n=1 Tax=Cryomyces antarcticus TaxID=329879 RepID=A0ABR0LYI5_9PEZI|nr:hypothetical protein LTR39_000740 [Cryomyces antarcticus]KAK5256680.1 hypothetical protein LTR16_002663 [Cryomyces antarcticus]
MVVRSWESRSVNDEGAVVDRWSFKAQWGPSASASKLTLFVTRASHHHPRRSSDSPTSSSINRRLAQDVPFTSPQNERLARAQDAPVASIQDAAYPRIDAPCTERGAQRYARLIKRPPKPSTKADVSFVCSPHHLSAHPNPQEDPPRVDPSCVAVGAAFWSLGRKLWVDKSLRLERTRGHNQAEGKP